MSKRTGKATLSAIAEAAGVSVATVSKVLNGRGGIAESTRARVSDLIRESGYRPNSVKPSQSDRPQVTVVFPNLESQYAASILDGIVLAAEDAGIEVVVTVSPELSTMTTPAQAEAWIARHRASIGAIIVTTVVPNVLIDASDGREFPLVALDPIDTDVSRLTVVASADLAGARSATDHLIAHGHRRIAWLGGLSGSTPSIERHIGYRAAMERAGLELDPEHQAFGDYTFDAGRAMAERMLARAERPTAMVCGNDAIAFGAIRQARRMGLRVPDDLSVIGYDDMPFAEWNTPTLTSVRQSVSGVGRVGLEALVAQASGRDLPSQAMHLSTRLIVRESTGPAPAEEH